MHVDDAIACLVDWLRNPRPTHGYPTFAYDIYLPIVAGTYAGAVQERSLAPGAPGDRRPNRWPGAQDHR
jgi:hypothetical protein